MLLRFSVGNYACFDERTTLDMVASDDEAHRETHVAGRDPSAVRLAALYGGNAAGKTKLCEAMEQSRSIILDGIRPGNRLPLDFFRLRSDTREGPASFEYVVRVDGHIWTYGFSATRRRVVEEWLWMGPPEAATCLFERSARGEEASLVEVTDALAALDTRKDARTRLDFLVEGTRDNQLFLTELRERQHPAVAPLVDWFAERFVLIAAAARYTALEQRSRREADFTAELGRFLEAAGTGIAAIEVDEQPLDLAALPSAVAEQILEDPRLDDGVVYGFADSWVSIARDAQGSVVITRLYASRTNAQGEHVRFDLSEESAGTRQLMNLFPLLLEGAECPTTFIVDELDRMLHPSLSRAFIDLFIRQCHPESQLIFTSHESRLMRREVMRQDEIWVFDKTRSGASRLKPLSDYEIPADMDMDTAYLEGRFGGVPYLGRLKSFGES